MAMLNNQRVAVISGCFCEFEPQSSSHGGLCGSSRSGPLLPEPEDAEAPLAPPKKRHG